MKTDQDIKKTVEAKPRWLKEAMGRPGRTGLHGSEASFRVNGLLKAGELNTVCVEARCPNKAECFSNSTATFMILGRTCTRGCAFCNVERAPKGSDADPQEPSRVARAVEQMGLDYAVVTSVTRDDLGDGGADSFADTVRAIHSIPGAPKVEVLIPDYTGQRLATVVASMPQVLAHNVEVVKRLTPHIRHARFSWEGSLRTLREAKERGTVQGIITKSSLMLGMGETDEEVEEAFADLIANKVDILALGQYLQPSRKHARVKEYIAPRRFDEWAEKGRRMGFRLVWAGPLVRTSYRAAEAYRQLAPDAP